MLERSAWKIALAAQIAALVASFTGFAGFPLDDAWIHQVVARTFATTGVLGYDPARFGSGSTSYAWAILLAPAYVLHARPVVYTFLLNATLWLVAGQMLLRASLVGAKTRREVAETTIVIVLACAGGNVSWFVVSGMEATLFLTLSIGVIAGLERLPRGNDRTALATGGALALLAWTRPESAGIVVLVGAWIALKRPPLRSSAIVLGGWALGVGAYALVNLVAIGHAAPATLAGRRWMWLAADPARSSLERAQSVGEQWAYRLRDFTLGTSSTLLFGVAIVVAAVGLGSIVRRKSKAEALLCAWATIHLGLYLVLLPALGHGGRYEPLVPFVFSIAVVRGAFAITRALGGLVPGSRAARNFAAIMIGSTPCAAFTIAGIAVWRNAEPLAVEHVERTEAGLATVFDSLPPDARIASFDIGASGFRSRRKLLDLGGLTDPTVLPSLRDGTVWQWLAAHRVDYVAIPLGYDDAVPDLFNFGYRLHLFDNPAIRLTPVTFLASPESVWLPGIASTMHSAPRQGIYRVSYPPASPSHLSASLSSTLAAREGAVDHEEERAVSYAAAAMANAGAPLDVRIEQAGGATSDDADRTVVDVEPAKVTVHFSPVLAAVPLGAAARIVDAITKPYLAAHDEAGAAQAAMFAITVLVRRHVDGRFDPLLPPTPYPKRDDVHDPPSPSTPLAVAAAHGTGAVADWIAEHPGAPLVDRDRYGKTALHVAIERFDLHVLELLLERAPELEARDAEGRTPLYFASQRGFVEGAAALLAAGADVDSTNGPEASTPLTAAAQTGSLPLVSLLLDHGAAVGAKTKWNQTALFFAARSTAPMSAATVELLLDHGADVRAQDTQGFTALHVAAAHDRPQAIDTLLHAGGDPAIPSAIGSTALDVALEGHCDLAAERLYEAGAPRARSKLPPPLFQAAAANDVDWMLHLLGAGASKDLRVEGSTALDVARANGATDAIVFLDRR